MRTNRLSIWLVCIGTGIALAIVALCSYNRTETALTSALCFRDFSTRAEDAEIADGVKVRILHKHSHDMYVSFGHAGGLGAGDDHYCVAEFAVDGRHYRWDAARDETPIVLRRDETGLYMATFDRTDMSRIDFRFYRARPDGRFEEIRPEQFPFALAVQNLWLDDEDRTLLAAHDPENYWFRKSLTARLWRKIDNPHTFSWDDPLDEAFVRNAASRCFGVRDDK